MAQRRPFTTYWGTPYCNFFTRNRNSSTENHFLSTIVRRCFCNDRHLPTVCKAVQLHKALIWQWCRHSIEIKVRLKLRTIHTRINTWRQWNKGKVVLSCTRDCRRLRVIHRIRHCRWNWPGDSQRDWHMIDHVSWMMSVVVLLLRLTRTRRITGHCRPPLFVSLN